MEILPASLVQHFKLYNQLSDEALNALAAISKHILVKRNTILQPIGHTCKTIYFIESGAARIFYFKEDVDITEYFAFENDILVRVESLFKNQPSRKAIEIIEDAKIIAIDATQLFKLYDVYADIERLFRKIFEESHVQTINRLENLQFHSAKERYLSLLADNPNISQRVPLKFIASYLGITQVSLSRIRASKMLSS